MSKQYQDMVYSVRAWSSGIAKRWDVSVGDVVYNYGYEEYSG